MTHWHSLYRRFIKCYFVVCGLKCNFCISDRSWEDCGKLHGEKGSMKYYLKGCLSAKECQSFELDSKCGLWYCKVICCKGDLWNGDRRYSKFQFKVQRALSNQLMRTARGFLCKQITFSRPWLVRIMTDILSNIYWLTVIKRIGTFLKNTVQKYAFPFPKNIVVG